MSLQMYLINETMLKNGKKLVIRRPVDEDACALINFLNTVGGESDNLLFGKDEFYLTVEKEAEYIEKVNSDVNAIMLLGLIGDKIASVAELRGFGKKRNGHNSELAISVKKDYWNKGVGSAMMEELLQFARDHQTIRNVSLGVKADNYNAIKLYEKFGFRKIGVHKDYFFINNQYYDEILMDLYL